MTKSGLNGNSVRTVMNTWTERAGYPLVNVKKKDKSLVLTQVKYLTLKSRYVIILLFYFLATIFIWFYRLKWYNQVVHSFKLHYE